MSRRRPAERRHEKASVFFYPSAPAAPSALFAVFTIWTKTKLVENSMFAIRFLCFFCFPCAFWWFSGHLPMLSGNGVAQILHMCSVVFEQHAVIPVEGSVPPEVLQSASFGLTITWPMQLQLWRRSNFLKQSNGCSFSPSWTTIMIYSFPAV